MRNEITRWQHPLIRMLDRPYNRRTMLAGLLGTVAAPALRLVAAGETTPVVPPGTEIEGEEEAVALLESAVRAVSSLETFRFELKTTRGTSAIFQGLDLKSVVGVVRRPMDIEATVTVGLPIGEISVTAVGLDGEFWLQDPLAAGEWISLGSDSQIQALINPDQLLLLAVRVVQDARITGTEKVGGEQMTVVEGTVDFAGMLQRILGGTEVAGMFEQGRAPGAKDVIFWIDNQDRVAEIEILGPIFVAESDDVIRDLVLYDFDDPVEIERPVSA